MNNEKIKVLIIPIIAIFIFLIALFGAAYAFFTSSVTLNNATYSINIPTQTSLVCTKTDCSANITPAMMLNTNTSNNTPKSTSTCYIDCTCSGTPGATCNYNVTLLETGTPYTASSGIGTDKEFSVQVTSPSGCTTQNSSSTETQVDTVKDKVVSSCNLTVSAGGSTSANVSAVFKWYNININQSTHIGQSYNYQITTENTRTIYRDTTETVKLNSNISEITQGYETNVNNITNDYFLKHVVEDDIIIGSYACVKYIENNELIVACVQGGKSSYYGSYDEMSSSNVSMVSNPTGNIKIIQSTQDYFTSNGGNCSYSSSSSYCRGAGLYLGSNSMGAATSSGESNSCRVIFNGNSSCSWSAV